MDIRRRSSPAIACSSRRRFPPAADRRGPRDRAGAAPAPTGTSSIARPFWGPERLPKPYGFKASPVGANGKLYLATEEGDVIVVRLGERFHVLETNTLVDQSFIASPVIVDGSIYLRSRTHLFRIDG